MTTIIHGWVYNPNQAMFGKKSDKAHSTKIACEAPQNCEIYCKQKSCLLMNGMNSCKFGRRIVKTGPTPRARSYYTFISDEQKEINAIPHEKLQSLKAYNRIALINGYYYLPYSHMSGAKSDGFAIESKWVAQKDMTPELLETITSAKPRAWLGGILKQYQEIEIPKFITDLYQNHYDLFEMLPEAQKQRIAIINHVGRQADITTCLPGNYVFGTQTWFWDGEKLTTSSILFQPVKGDLKISLIPLKGESVKITDNSQVGPNTIFMD